MTLASSPLEGPALLRAAGSVRIMGYQLRLVESFLSELARRLLFGKDATT
jgi:hypothetical protein